jgi:hypothetical protein
MSGGKRRSAAHLPTFAVDLGPAFARARAAVRHESLAEHDTKAADQGFRTGHDRPATGAQCNARYREHKQRTECGDGRDHRQRDAVTGHIGIDQHQRADHERDDAAEAQRAEGGQKRLGNQEGEAQKDQAEPYIADGQHLHGEQADQQADRPYYAGQHEAGISELEEQAIHADHQQNQCHVRVGDHGEEMAAPVGFERDDGRVGRVQPLVACNGIDRAAVEFAQQVGHVARGQVDYVLGEGFIGRQAHGFSHRVFGPIGVAAAQLCQTADIGGRVVDLLAEFGRLGVERYRAGVGVAGGSV